jgi:hypothetical protein
MLKTFHPFPSIGAFKSVVFNINKKLTECDIPVSFNGTIKSHGTNAAIIGIFSNKKMIDFYYQSRNRIVTINSDNMGFAKFVGNIPKHELKSILFDPILEHLDIESDVKIIIYGEYCGKGIQQNVAISKLPRMFISFSIRIETFETTKPNDEDAAADDDDDDSCIKRIDLLSIKDDKWSNNDEYKLYNTNIFPNFEIKLNMDNPKFIINKLIELTEKVEEECPIGKYFGVYGIGEGIVWKCREYPSSMFWFKVKGEKHSVTKITKMNKIVQLSDEKVQDIKTFIETTVTDNRLNQGLDYLREMNLPISKTSIGTFIKWVSDDVIKEESNLLQISNLDETLVKKHISSKALYFIKKHVI